MLERARVYVKMQIDSYQRATTHNSTKTAQNRGPFEAPTQVKNPVSLIYIMRHHNDRFVHRKLLINKDNSGGGTLGPRGLPLFLYTQPL